MLRRRHDRDVVVRALDALDILKRQWQDPVSIADENLRQLRPRRLQCLFRAIEHWFRFEEREVSNAREHALQAISSERLEQIVQGAKFERGDRILIVRGREDDPGTVFEPLEHLQPCGAWHHDVQEDQVGTFAVRDGDGALAVTRLMDRSSAAQISQLRAERLPGQRFVVRHENGLDHLLTPLRPPLVFVGRWDAEARLKAFPTALDPQRSRWTERRDETLAQRPETELMSGAHL